jgi:hypothetical protein
MLAKNMKIQKRIEKYLKEMRNFSHLWNRQLRNTHILAMQT